jgi:hypothetical protein
VVTAELRIPQPAGSEKGTRTSKYSALAFLMLPSHGVRFTIMRTRIFKAFVALLLLFGMFSLQSCYEEEYHGYPYYGGHAYVYRYRPYYGHPWHYHYWRWHRDRD